MSKTLVQIGILAVVVRLLLFVQVGADPRFDRPYSDMLIYHNWASYWGVDGEAYPYEPVGEPFWRSPGYPAFLSLVYRLVGDHIVTGPRTAAAIQMALGAAATIAVAGYALRRWGRWAAWLTAGLCTLHAPLLFCEILILPVGLATPLLTFTGLGVLALQEGARPNPRRAVATGLLAGVNAIVRPNLGLVLPIAAWLLWRRKETRPNAWWLLGAAALPLLGTTGWNLARSGEVVVTGANGPLNLYFAYGEYAGPTFDARDQAWGNPETQARSARRLMAEETGRPVEEIGRKEASRYWGDKAWQWMGENPARVPVLAAEKVLGVVTWRDLAVIVPVAASNGAMLILNLLIVPFPLILFAALFAAWRVRGGAATAVWIGFVPILVSAVLYFTYTRFRVPAVPLLSLAGGVGLIEWTRALRGAAGKGAPEEGAAAVGQRRRLAAVGFALAAVFLVWASWIPWLRAEAYQDRYWNTPLSKGWHQVGVGWVTRYKEAEKQGLRRPEMLEKAIAAFERAQAIQPQTPLNREWIARVERDHRGNGRMAWEIFDELLPQYPPERYTGIAAELALCEALGLGPTGRPRYRRAVELFDEVQRHHGLHFQYWEAYADALRATGRQEEACEYLRKLSEDPRLTPEEQSAKREKLASWDCGG